MDEDILSGDLVDERDELSLDELCHFCSMEAELVAELVNEGILKPFGREQTAWRFTFISVEVVRKTRRLQRDLGLNLQGAALALELLEEIDRLQSRLKVLNRR